MATRARRPERREEPLSRERIVGAAVELLDEAGETGLTFRALTERLATGPGAIYWHVANKDELLATATNAAVTAALVTGSAGTPDSPDSPDSPGDTIRAIALGLFDAIDEHPWLGTQLALQMSRNPRQTATLRIFESIGRQVRGLGVPESSQFTAIFALVYYILGAAGQNAVNRASARVLRPGVDRSDYLDAVVTEWEALDPDEYPFIRAAAGQLRDHDDRSEFLAGVDLILAGITTVHSPGAQPPP